MGHLMPAYLHYWVSANKLSKGEHLKTPGGATVTVVGGTTPKQHDGWMWDLTVPGNNDHDFYVLPPVNNSADTYTLQAGGAPVLVHNEDGEGDDECQFPGAEARAKVPDEWGNGQPNAKGIGQRWTDPQNPGNGVRIDQGNPDSPFPSQQVDHVVVRSGGRILGPDGSPIEGPLGANPQAHIPLTDWLQWMEWNEP
jgi:putative hemolysin